MEDINSSSSLADGGASGDTGALQVADSTAQADDQGQSSDQSSHVDNSDRQTASTSGQGSKSNSFWAQQRVLEKNLTKTVERLLEEKLKPLFERQNTAGPPAAKIEADEPPDFNNFNTWLQKKLDNAIEAMKKDVLEKEIPKKFSQFDAERQSQNQVQDARKYLISQKDILTDENKLSEIQQIMRDNLLDHAAANGEPLRAVQKAVEIWRSQRKNPNAPNKEHLSTVGGGNIKTGVKSPATMDQLKALQNRLMKATTIEDQEKLSQEIDAAMASLKES